MRVRPALRAGPALLLVSLALLSPRLLRPADPGAARAASTEPLAALRAADSASLAGHPELAVRRLHEALANLPGGARDETERIRLLIALGESECELGANPGSAGHLAEALSLARRRPVAADALLAQALNAFGRTAKNQGRYAEARRSHEEAARIAGALGGAGLAELALARAGLGNTLRRDPAKRDSSALLLGEACELMQRAEGDSSLALARLRMNHALVLLQLGRLAEARTRIDAARPVLARHLSPAHASLAFADQLAGWLAFRLGDLAGARAPLEEALAVLARLRNAAEPGSQRMRFRPKAADGLAGVHLAMHDEARAWDVLDAAQSLLQRETLGDLDEAIGVGSPPHTLPEVQACLDSHTALVGWLDLNLVEEPPVASWIYVLRDRGRVHWLRLPGRNASGGASVALERLRRRLVMEAAWPTRLAPSEALAAAAHDAWAERLAPAESLLAGVDHLIVVLSPLAATVPVESMTGGDGRPVGERYAVSYVHSPSTLVDLHARTAGLASLERTAPLLVRAADERGLRLAAAGSAERALRRELGAVRATHPPAWLQFDGHALVDPRVPGRSALLLDPGGPGARHLRDGDTGGAFADAPDDGLLSSSEIAALEVPVPLVVLAACQSAGRFDYGGFDGVGDAFLGAGAGAVLSSLWPVDERATRELMRRFLDAAFEPDGTPRRDLDESLRLARTELRSLRARDGSRPFAHPAYWAPFVLVGEGRLPREGAAAATSTGPVARARASTRPAIRR